MTFTIEEENILCIFRDESAATGIPIKDLIIEAISFASDPDMKSLLNSVLDKLRSEKFDPAVLNEIVPVYNDAEDDGYGA